MLVQYQPPMDAVILTKKLIEIESVTGNELRMAEFLRDWFVSRQWNAVVLQRVSDPSVDPKRYNLFARFSSQTSGLILINSHIDTVPPYFAPYENDGKIYGRGACDTKGVIAAQLIAIDELCKDKELAKHLAILYVVGEEVDHIGMTKANDIPIHPSVLIVGEPTENKLVQYQKGMIKIRLISRGKAAHSGYPHLGKSAIENIVNVLYELQRASWPVHPHFGPTTLNIGLLNGGRAANVVSDYAEAMLMFRVVGSCEEILKQLTSIVGDRCELVPFSSNEPVQLDTVSGNRKKFELSNVAFNTDIAFYHQKDPNSKRLNFLYGPGSILNAHAEDEHIEIAQLNEACEGYVDLVQQIYLKHIHI